MLLASVADIRASLGFDDMTDINAAVTAALDAAEVELSATLDADFAETDVVDTFWVREPGLKEGSHVATEFRFSKGLLTAVPAVMLAQTVPLFGTAAAIAITTMKFDLTKGTARDWHNDFDHQYVRFTYTAGYPADETDAISYDLDIVPTWLQEAAKLQAMINLADSPSLTEANIKLDVKMMNAQLTNILRSKIRYAPLALLPL